jgi:hypothetical protein
MFIDGFQDLNYRDSQTLDLSLNNAYTHDAVQTLGCKTL